MPAEVSSSQTPTLKGHCIKPSCLCSWEADGQEVTSFLYRSAISALPCLLNLDDSCKIMKTLSNCIFWKTVLCQRQIVTWNCILVGFFTSQVLFHTAIRKSHLYKAYASVHTSVNDALVNSWGFCLFQIPVLSWFPDDP